MNRSVLYWLSAEMVMCLGSAQAQSPYMTIAEQTRLECGGIMPTVGDFDGDGVNDLVLSSGDNFVRFHAAPGVNGLLPFTISVLPTPTPGAQCHAATIDGYGSLDLVVHDAFAVTG